MDKYEKKHQRNLSAFGRQVDAIFKQAATEAAALGITLDDLPTEGILSLSNLPRTERAVKEMMENLVRNLSACIINGITLSWQLANEKNGSLCDKVFGDIKDELSDEMKKRYYSNNSEALEAFLQRKEAGLKLSERVWRYADEFKNEIEMGLDVGIRDGVAAERMQRGLQQYLRNPNMLFRRVRDIHGNLQLSKRAKEYHPGRGVYRSSYKNARRLTVTETNMAYRSADYLRFQNLDFVVGVRIVLSNNHPDDDICNELSAPLGSTYTKGKGCYPKDFKFVGWHPHCRCHVETILKTEDELAADNKRIMDGKKPSEESENTVSKMPSEFNAWVRKNEKRIKNAKTLPYFIRDNKDRVDSILTK